MNTNISLLRFAVVIAGAALALPAAARADLVRVGYTGIITSVHGDGLGYAQNDTIAGFFELDTDDLRGTSDSHLAGNGPVTSNTGDGGFVTEYDYTEYYHNYHHTNNGFDYIYESIYLRDGSYGSYHEYLYDPTGRVAGYRDIYANFVHYIELFDYHDGFCASWDAHYDADLLSRIDGANGYVYDYGYELAHDYTDGSYSYRSHSNAAYFSLTSVYTYTAPVPEPGALGLLGLGLAGILFSRRRSSHLPL